jgi:hypothetical protein
LLNGAEDEIWLVEPEDVTAPGLIAKMTAPLVQMVAETSPPEADFAGIVPLDESHADQMSAGPCHKTRTLGAKDEALRPILRHVRWRKIDRHGR